MRTCNYAYVTLMSTQDYLPAVLILAESLKKVHSHFPLLVGIVEELYDNNVELLKSAGCFVEKIKKLSYNQETINKYKDQQSASVLNTASKISLFSLKNWEKLVYIDADTMVLQNVDELFNWPDGSMLQYDGDEGGFTGLMVICPSKHREDFYECLMQNFPCADGDLLGSLWFHVKTNATYQIPAEYLTHYGEHIETEYLEPAKWRDIKILHFCNSPKPWIEPPEEDYSHWYMTSYLNQLQYVKDKYHI